MAIKYLLGTFQIKRFYTDAILTAVIEEAELIGDFRGQVPSLRLGNGTTPGGVVVAVGEVLGSVKRPLLVAPINNATGISVTPLLTGSAYSAVNPVDSGADAHVASTWTIALDAAMTNVIHTSGRDTINLTTYDLQAEGITLPAATKVYVTITYESTSGLEATSTTSAFTTE